VAELFVSRRAEEELREIWRHIAADNPAAADRLLLRIDGKLQLLRDFPGIGTLRDDIRPGLRMLVEGYYLLLYEHDAANDAVELVSVIDGRRDLSTVFQRNGRSPRGAPPTRVRKP
jgi:toxin ParE1/3/4